MTSREQHDRMANAIRFLAMDAVEKAQSGHPGLPMGMADVATVLFSRFLKFDSAHPNWPDRDRFVLSAGHGSMLPQSWMSRANSIVCPGAKLDLAMQLILTPLIMQLIERKRNLK